jgi:hypothetical protein
VRISAGTLRALTWDFPVELMVELRVELRVSEFTT